MCRIEEETVWSSLNVTSVFVLFSRKDGPDWMRRVRRLVCLVRPRVDNPNLLRIHCRVQTVLFLVLLAECSSSLGVHFYQASSVSLFSFDLLPQTHLSLSHCLSGPRCVKAILVILHNSAYFSQTAASFLWFTVSVFSKVPLSFPHLTCLFSLLITSRSNRSPSPFVRNSNFFRVYSLCLHITCLL